MAEKKMGLKELLEKEADLSRLSWTIGSYSEVDSSGIPMCGKLEGIDYSTDIQTITLDRLFAKLSIRITHNSLKNTSMTSDINYNMCNQSLYLRQANSRIHPFSKTEQIIYERKPSVVKIDIPKLFEQPYIRPKNLVSDKIKSLNTAKKYLTELEDLGLLTKSKLGKEYIWFNTALMDILSSEE